MSMNPGRIDFRAVLLRLQEASRTLHTEQLKLALECLNIPPRSIENVKTISDAYDRLFSHQETSEIASSLLYLILKEIHVSASELAKLTPYTTVDGFAKCKKRKDLAFAKLIIQLCNDMNEEDFGRFFSLCCAYFDHTINREQYPTIEKLLQKLIHSHTIWPGSVEILCEVLREMKDKSQALQFVEDYKDAVRTIETGCEEGGAVTTSDQCTSGGEEEKSSRFGGGIQATESQANGLSGQHSSLVATGGPPAARNETPTMSAQRSSHPVDSQGQHEMTSTATPFTSQSGDSTVIKLDAPPDGLPTDVETDRKPLKKQGLSSNSQPSKQPKPQRDSAVGTSFGDSTSVRPQHVFITVHGGIQSGPTTGGSREEGATPAQADTQSINDSETEALLKDKRVRKSLLKNCCLKFKKPIVCGGTLTTPLFLGLLSVVLIIVGGVGWSSQQALIDENTLTETQYIVEGDTVILGTVDASLVSKVTVEEMTQSGDSSHSSNVYLVPVSDLEKYMTTNQVQRPTLYLKTPSNFTGLINGVYFGDYLLDASFINYSFNIASQSSRGTGSFYIFDNNEKFDDFINKVAGADHSAVFCRQFNIGEFNKSEPTPIQYPVTESSYYFFVADLPGDIFFNFSYMIKDIYLNFLDYEPKCKDLYESGSACSIDLPESGVFHVLAYAEPHVDSESPTTHLQLSTTVLQGVRQLETTYKVLTLVGVALLVCCMFCFCVFTGFCVRHLGII